MSLWPGRRRSNSAWISASASGRRGGQPSITTPTAAPWLSPQVEIVKSFPNVLGIALREGWTPKPPPQAANPEDRGNLRGARASYHNAIYNPGPLRFYSSSQICMILRLARLWLASGLFAAAPGLLAQLPTSPVARPQPPIVTNLSNSGVRPMEMVDSF